MELICISVKPLIDNSYFERQKKELKQKENSKLIQEIKDLLIKLNGSHFEEFFILGNRKKLKKNLIFLMNASYDVFEGVRKI